MVEMESCRSVGLSNGRLLNVDSGDGCEASFRPRRLVSDVCCSFSSAGYLLIYSLFFEEFSM